MNNRRKWNVMYTPAEIAEDVETSFIPASEQTGAVRAAIIAAIEADRAQRGIIEADA